MDYGYYNHQETYFAMHSAQMGMLIAVEPDDCGDNASDYGQQENPPEEPCYFIAVFGEPGIPVATSVMEINVIARENRQQNSKYDMPPH